MTNNKAKMTEDESLDKGSTVAALHPLGGFERDKNHSH